MSTTPVTVTNTEYTITDDEIPPSFKQGMVEIDLIARAEKAEAELARLRSENNLLKAVQKISEEADEPFFREVLEARSILAAYDVAVKTRNHLKTELEVMTARAEKAEAECLEQARLLGISGSREATLLSEMAKLETELAAEREKVRVLRSTLERRHTEQGYHRQYVDDVLDATKEDSK